MKNIIDVNEVKSHSIEPYRFKVLGGAQVVEATTCEEKVNTQENEEVAPVVKEPEFVQEEVQVKQQNEFVEELLKRSDELSTNIIKLQMQIEKQEAEFERRLQNELERAKQSSYEEGYNKAKEELNQSVIEIKEKYFIKIYLKIQ